MRCNRTGCENIMCDVLIDNKYICPDCLQEFENNCTAPGEHKIGSILKAFREFMQSHKDLDNPKMATVKDWIKSWRDDE